MLENTLGLEGNIERVDLQYTTFKNDILVNTIVFQNTFKIAVLYIYRT